MTIITDQVRTDVLAGGWDRNKRKAIILLPGCECTPFMRIRKHTLIQRYTNTHTRSASKKKIQTETHANEHLGDLNLAPNEHFRGYQAENKCLLHMTVIL